MDSNKETAIIYHENYLKHFSGESHPERRERLIETMNFLREMGILSKTWLVTPEPADEKEILLAHTREHLNFIRSICENGGGPIDMDTYAQPNTYEIAKLSAGGAICAGRLVMENKARNSFALIRPPGHHATRDRAMGFCYFNNVAIMIRYLQKRFNLKRIFLLDWDAHAFNGTMDIFYSDNSVLDISIHQDPRSFYPGTGFIDQIGIGEGEGYTVNIPVPSGTGNSDYLYIMKKFIIPLAITFKPEIIVISAGQDSHRDDFISGLCLTEKGYHEMTRLLNELSKDICNGRLVIELEGGYNLNALARSNYAIIKALLSDYWDLEIKETPRREIEDIVKKLIERFREFHSL